MGTEDLVGKAQTVLGPVAGEDLGVTIVHEHLFTDQSMAWFTEPSEPSQKFLAHQPVTLENLGWIHRHSMQNLDNLRLLDEDEAISEVMLCKRGGVRTIVEETAIGLAPDPLGLTRVARATGLNVIMATGYYVGKSHPPDMDRKSEDDLVDEFVREITVGRGDTGVRAGIIGEIGCSWPLQDNERKCLRAAGRAQKLTGAPLSIHPGRVTVAEDPPFKIVEEEIAVVADVGADLSRVIICHIWDRVRDPGDRRKLAEMGCYLGYDSFGGDYPGMVMSDFHDAASDAQCITEIAQLIREGYQDHIVVGHDSAMKVKRRRYGGPGLAWIVDEMVPLMRIRGFSEEQIHSILVENPKRILSFV